MHRIGVVGGLVAAAVVAHPTPTTAQAAPDVWISTESALLSQPSDVLVAPDGRVYVLDALENRLLVLGAPGEVELRVGREGSGPGEFREPSVVSPLSDGFEVLDRGNNRLQRFDADGTPVSTHPLPRFGSLYPASIQNGRVAVNTLSESTLVTLFDATGTQTSTFAEQAAPMPQGISMPAVRRQILEGEIPGFFRNTVEPRFAPDGSVWLAWLTDGRVERWTPAGRREATHELDEPELAEIREDFFDLYRDPQMRGLPSLSYISDVYPTASGAWILLKADDEGPAVVVHVSPEGERMGRWTFPEARGATRLAVDESRGSVFFTLGATAELVSCALSGLPASLERRWEAPPLPPHPRLQLLEEVLHQHQ